METSDATASLPRADVPLIDSDLHNTVPSLETLYPYLPDFWADYCRESAFVGPDANDYPGGVPITAKPETKPESGPAGSDLGLMQTQVLDAWNVEYGILNCAYRVQSVHNPYLAAALASAINDWQIEHWLEPEPRLRASLVVPSQVPELAAKEIERVGNHPGFVQIALPVRSLMPYGNRMHFPLYEAAVRHDLVIGIQYGGAPGHPPSPSGWFSTYLEDYAGMAQIFQAQVISLVCEGAFDQFPSLRVALIEGGFTWMPSVMWRIDKEWRGLRHNTPWVKRRPSEYMREHIRLTLQPLDAPHDSEHLLQFIAQLDSDDMLMFSTDYPHWHFDTPTEAFPAGLPGSLARKILAENAREFYRL
jgi:uncharacterized protein